MFSFNTYERETSSLILTTTLKVQKLGACFFCFFFFFIKDNFIENDIISYLGKKKGQEKVHTSNFAFFLDWSKTLHLSSDRLKLEHCKNLEPNKNKENAKTKQTNSEVN